MNRLCGFVVCVFLGVVLSVSSVIDVSAEVSVGHEEYVRKSSTRVNRREYKVAQDGSGDFKTIQQGVDTVPDGATLRIKNGVYEENVRIHDKTVNLIGESREKCIIKVNNDKYFEVPLEIASGVVENITIYGCTDRSGDWISAKRPVSEEYINSFETDLEKKAARYTGYAVHIEQDYLKDRTLTFKNCEILSDNSHCVGVGLRKGCNLVFDNCILRSFGQGGGDMFIHDTPIGEDYGSCDVTIKDCQFYCYNSLYFLHLGSVAEADNVSMHFLNNKFHVVSYSNPSNYYSDYKGITVTNMNNMDIDNTLVDSGFSGNDLVFCFDEAMTSDFKSKVVGVDNPLESPIEMPEGVVVLWNDRQMIDKQCYFPINIINNGFDGGDWLNSASFVLASDSIGNTFSQFNYKD